jgi:hypothetical protein
MEQPEMPSMRRRGSEAARITKWADELDHGAIDTAKRPLRRERYAKRQALTIGQVLAWADAHHARTGRWPGTCSGNVHGVPHETWARIDNALVRGYRGFPGGFTLLELLFEARGAQYRYARKNTKLKKILAWACAHFEIHGTWPHERSGGIPNSNGETWGSIYNSLRLGKYARRRRRAIERLVAKRRVPNALNKPADLSIAQILRWADTYFTVRGRWPTAKSRGLRMGPTVSWRIIDEALRLGMRGLPGGKSLEGVLEENGRGIANFKNSAVLPLTKRDHPPHQGTDHGGRPRLFRLSSGWRNPETSLHGS